MSVTELEEIGLKNVGKVYHNLSYDKLIEHELEKKECALTKKGATAVDTGIFTGRSPKDKYFVDRDPSNRYIAWGDVNQKISEDIFNELLEVSREQLSGKDLYVTDVFSGASDTSKRSIRFITEIAWQAHFVKNMFIRPTDSELEVFKPNFTVLNACKAVNDKWKEHGLNSEVFVLFDIENNLSIIGGTWYGGELKKGIFSMMNYWLPLEDKLSMHCSANVGEKGDTALFFGLSGTGKTTLSTDPRRRLIGDDEHGWDNEGVFNFEGGCYAKVINLDDNSEPEIYNAIRTGALLENVVMYGEGEVDYKDSSKTENTRVSYPIEHIENHETSLSAGHPENIIFLTADAFGVLPPVSKLTREQAMYYFLSGYTAKVAGTERGITKPVATFSACFGEAFLPLHPTVYAKLLGEKIDKHNVSVYLVNTGWTGGAYGVGHRMSIKDTRACINAILDGSIKESEFDVTKTFKLHVPKTLGNINPEILNPRNAWSDKDEFDRTRDTLAEMFIENFKKYQTANSEFDYSAAGPKQDN
ncbi:MAG: phosphoenolpyruvate carboxykinase (ATP) [Sulfurimonas sp. RIFOXYD12_FULL_33_39]|uniref:phosphoenolpyruvate carboxykinase (ATP) n=1 Tax=unclassified Sulfurimonas TaxID=2623549 RepID=UPI0008B20F3C|nr:MULTISPECIES: phosphoenolpyruvate carboxykinase (ATP) [unclassified Sulfurimonas]OHE09615.1 MAG: phosphoenolpyruvate carboxykinase (ATP) [Sulfurimonas sp. RIFOXYD12_FULL_33_39]OHE13878.1 MAG: phosphoenolpyruvate carboxykinase (ATP) [Sulfurimonas sp. RIFOXYD2_FULL_34_21]